MRRALLMLCLAACAGDIQATQEAESVDSPTAMARSILPQVEEIRGRKFLKEVPVRVVDDEEAREHFVKRLDQFGEVERMRQDQAAFELLGLWPEEIDMFGLTLELLEEQAGGFYDPQDEVFCMLEDMPAGTGPIIMAHELTHALDDQLYGIDEMLKASMISDDRAMAVGSLVEGSGTLLMTIYTQRAMRKGEMSMSALMEMQTSEAGKAEKLRAAPDVMQRGLIAPYLLGMSFLLRGDMMRILKPEAIADVDKAFANPPQSSEQILHPEKYWDEAQLDPPRDLSLPDLSTSLGAGWSREADGVLGELLSAILTGGGPVDLLGLNMDSWTNPAASGWDGDQWNLYVNGEQRAAVLGTVWDSETDAEEFEAALKTEGRVILRRGDAVVLAAGENAAPLAEAALSALAP